MKIESMSCRRILNSHGDFTGEYVVELDDGRSGAGAAPQGETISIYEDRQSAIDPETIITSMKIRAIDTARILVGDSVPFVGWHLRDERNFGAMEGHTALEVKHFKPRILFIKVWNDTHTVNPPGGEPFEDLRERAKRLRRLVFRRYHGSSVLAVSHGTFLQQFHGLLRGKSCIESLADWTLDIEMTSFTFSGNRLIEERTARLAGAGRLDW
jgi:broad specificity phosphatase PhoE